MNTYLLLSTIDGIIDSLRPLWAEFGYSSTKRKFHETGYSILNLESDSTYALELISKIEQPFDVSRLSFRSIFELLTVVPESIRKSLVTRSGHPLEPSRILVDSIDGVPYWCQVTYRLESNMSVWPLMASDGPVIRMTAHCPPPAPGQLIVSSRWIAVLKAVRSYLIVLLDASESRTLCSEADYLGSRSWEEVVPAIRTLFFCPEDQFVGLVKYWKDVPLARFLRQDLPPMPQIWKTLGLGATDPLFSGDIRAFIKRVINFDPSKENAPEKLKYPFFKVVFGISQMKKGCDVVPESMVKAAYQKHAETLSSPPPSHPLLDLSEIRSFTDRVLRGFQIPRLSSALRDAEVSLSASNSFGRLHGGSRAEVRQFLFKFPDFSLSANEDAPFVTVTLDIARDWIPGLSRMFLDRNQKVVTDYSDYVPSAHEWEVLLQLYARDFNHFHVVSALKDLFFTLPPFRRPTWISSVMEVLSRGGLGHIDRPIDLQEARSEFFPWCKVVAIREPLKVRMITAMNGLRSFFATVAQRAIHSYLKKFSPFKFIGKTLTAYELDDLITLHAEFSIRFGVLAGQGIGLASGDYSAATDRLNIDVSQMMGESLLDHLNPLDRQKRSLLFDLLDNQYLEYPPTQISGVSPDPILGSMLQGSENQKRNPNFVAGTRTALSGFDTNLDQTGFMNPPNVRFRLSTSSHSQASLPPLQTISEEQSLDETIGILRDLGFDDPPSAARQIHQTINSSEHPPVPAMKISHHRIRPFRYQRNGQLMGSVLSFPLLCIANLYCFVKSLGIMTRFLSGAITMNSLPVFVNGDDIFFISDAAHYQKWLATIPIVGFSPSQGKNFFHPTLGTMNSVPIALESRVIPALLGVDRIIKRLRVSEPPTWPDIEELGPLPDIPEKPASNFVILDFMNVGLLTGQSKLSGRAALADMPLRDWYALSVPTAMTPTFAHKRFLHYHRDSIVRQTRFMESGTMNIFAHPLLGGLGFPRVDGINPSYSPDQRRLAFLLKAALLRPFTGLETDSPWSRVLVLANKQKLYQGESLGRAARFVHLEPYPETAPAPPGYDRYVDNSVTLPTSLSRPMFLSRSSVEPASRLAPSTLRRLVNSGKDVEGYHRQRHLLDPAEMEDFPYACYIRIDPSAPTDLVSPIDLVFQDLKISGSEPAPLVQIPQETSKFLETSVPSALDVEVEDWELQDDLLVRPSLFVASPLQDPTPTPIQNSIRNRNLALRRNAELQALARGYILRDTPEVQRRNMGSQ